MVLRDRPAHVTLKVVSETPWARRTDLGWLLRVRVQPSAGRSQIVGEHDGALKVRVAAPANEGKANVELIRFLTRTLGVARGSVELRSGERSRAKTVEVRGDIEPIRQLMRGE